MRIDRFDESAVSEIDGTLTERHYRIFEAMAPYECLDRQYICALSGYSDSQLRDLFREWKKAPHRYIEIAEGMKRNRRHKELYRNTVLAYSLTDKIRRRMRDRGFDFHSYGCNGMVEHKLMTSWGRASFDLAQKEGAIQVIPFHQIAAEVGIKEKAPCFEGAEKRSVYFDCYPFGIANDDWNALLLYENDCDTEDLGRIEEKYANCLHIIETRQWQRFEFDRVHFLFVTTGKQHMENMMDRLPKKLARYALFKVHPALFSDDRPRATGHMVTEPWERVGHPSLTLTGGSK